MPISRLETAFASIGMTDPGRVGVYNMSEVLPREILGDLAQVEQPFKPLHDAYQAAGYDVAPEITGPFDHAIVTLPRSKAAARDMIARAVDAVESGLIVVDGQKTDGVDSLYNAVRKRNEVSGTVTKSHGRCFWFTAGDDFSDWRADPLHVDGFQTQVGVFSAEKVDRGSALLASLLPRKISGRVADLGAGWGYLSAQILKADGVKALDVIEADHRALDCARINISDPRAAFHWADVTGFKAVPYDAIVTNPPFHVGRSGDPALGLAFLSSAARLLKSSGTLWMVANRHLPYEEHLGQKFIDVTEIGGNGGFKVIRASRPRSAR